LQLRILPAGDLLPALARGDVDLVMSGLTITPEREQQVAFTAPYLQTGQMAIIRTTDVMRFHNPASLMQGGFKVGFVEGSAGATYVKSSMASATPVSVADSAAGLQALLDKRIDVLVDDAATSWSIATEPRYKTLMSLNRPLTEEFLAWAVNKNNGALREQLNQVLLNVKRQQVFEHILNRWIPVRVAAE
jgi:polar amino acid transport system substrate-binding protein